mmetsp:Transcript_22414/g.63625  ORF Transcript_22414/g.63625 Transcript_22414/m.63625 type:complete len:770 (+) Transcript_22414:83-2392(+)
MASTMDASMWTVIGGGARGGLAVREGGDISAPETGVFLATGAVVRALELEDGCMRFELVRGDGPSTGWVSTRFKGKELVTATSEKDSDEASTTEGSSPGEPDDITPEEEMLLAYAARLSAGTEEQGQEEQRALGAAGVDREALDWRAGGAEEDTRERAGDEVQARAELEQALRPTGAEGESEARAVLRRLNEEEAARTKRDREEKDRLRAEYGIGWKVENIPVNMASRSLGCEPQPSFMCALVLDGAGSIRVAPTVEPAAAVNLEYLSTALRVRREDGREPFFSLDPVVGADTAAMQSKRFEPAWLIDTCLGEVMFQADYRLKELSMGEHMQPVVGMKSCFDFFDGREKHIDWNAREWFVVRKASVLVSGDNALIPYISMGVEAREQVMSDSGMVDAQVTRPDHPLARYAEVFTQKFDLIAERLSVVNQLREVAKASVLAKYLLDSGAHLDESWFNLASAFEGSRVTQVPQLWNERYHAKVQVKDGTIDEEALRPHMLGVYGGVQFGLEKFTVGARAASASVQFARVGARGPMPRVSAALSMATSVTGGLRTPAMRAAVSMRAGGVPRGVDLNLDGFEFSETERVSDIVLSDAGSATPMGSSFWQMIDDHDPEESLFADKDVELLRAVFHPRLSDRRAEGDLFVPPPTCGAHAARLRALVREEAAVQDQRRRHFFSAKFDERSVGALFPFSWQDPFRAQAAPPRLRLRADLLEQAGELAGALGAAVATFDKLTEEGSRFRAYRFGGLEVRTYQDADGPETVGAILAQRA